MQNPEFCIKSQYFEQKCRFIRQIFEIIIITLTPTYTLLFHLDVWAGSMSTVALTVDNEVLVCGLNNYSQVKSRPT
jgi:hypothetical protein